MFLINTYRQTLFFLFVLLSTLSHAEPTTTHRVPYFSNNEVTAWKTIIYPSSKQQLISHRHENNRVLVALTNGTLKITNNKSHVHYLTLEKGKAYYLTKDTLGETHTDENISRHPISVIVISLNEK